MKGGSRFLHSIVGSGCLWGEENTVRVSLTVQLRDSFLNNGKPNIPAKTIYFKGVK